MKNAWFLAALLLAGSLDAPAAAQMGPPVPMTLRQYSATTAGQPVRIVVRVDDVNRSRLRADVLERRTDSTYAPTGKQAELFLDDQTPIVMGSMRDVRSGAVLFVSGVATTKWHADVKKVIVLTKYVTIGA